MFRDMSTNSDLLFQAGTRISNPFVLCSLISGRTRQLIMSGNGNRSTVQLVHHALNELLAGVLEFEMYAEKDPKSKAALSHGHLNAACREVLEVRAS
jgi:hypothetical protein